MKQYSDMTPSEELVHIMDDQIMPLLQEIFLLKKFIDKKDYAAKVSKLKDYKIKPKQR